MTLNEWFKDNCSLSNLDRTLINQQISGFMNKPKISILMPVYKTRLAWLKKCIDSVKNQIYQNWELCICNDGSNDDDIQRVLANYQKSDSRIKLVTHTTNKGIVGATNSAFELATGEYIAFSDSDDLLLEQTLYLIVHTINKNSQAKFIYTDEIFMDADDNCTMYYFKPDWSPDTLRSQNYTNHFSVYIKSIIGSELLKEGYSNSQDYDFVLRMTENLKSNEISHIPTIGYRWRQHVQQTGASNASLAFDGASRAIREHLERKSVKAKVLFDWPWYRIKYQLEEYPMVDILICSRNKNDMLIRCIENILCKTDYPNYKIYLCVDEVVKKRVFFEFKLLVNSGVINFVPRTTDESFNFSRFVNRLVQASSSKLICLYNDDVEPITDYWLSEMSAIASQSHVGAVGCKLLYADLRLQHVGAALGINQVAEHFYKWQPFNLSAYHGKTKLITNVSVVTAAVMVLRRNVFNEIGSFDEELAIAYNDVDFCIKLLEAGYYNVCNPYAVMYHLESQTRGLITDKEKEAKFLAEMQFMKDRWGDKLQHDPFYNPNLSLNSESAYLAIDKPRYKKPWL